MQPIRTRRDLASLLERQMSAASLRAASPNDDEIEGRTALKTYLLAAHGPMRTDPLATLGALVSRAGLTVEPAGEPALLALAQGELQFWLDTSGGPFFRLHTTASARDADRVHEALVQCSPLLQPAWVLPASLESLARRVEGRMVLFSLRHDRRALCREADEGREGVDLVTLRFWAPSASETLERFRHGDVLPGATSVHSVRVRAGEPDAYALAEVYHNGKFTAIGSSFAQLEKLLGAVTEEAAALAHAFESDARPRRVEITVPWTVPDLPYAVLKMFNGSEPFGLWGIPETVGEARFRVRAMDLGFAHAAVFEVGPEGVAFELAPGTPAAVAVRFVANLQYHVHSAIRCDALAEPLLAHGAKKSTGGGAPFHEKSEMAAVARVVLAEACGQWVRGAASVTAEGLVRAACGPARFSPAMVDLARRVMTEAAAFEWREWLRVALSAEGTTMWKFTAELPLEHTQRVRELARLHRHALQLVARVSGGIAGPWTQLSLLDAEALAVPVGG
jgi:hypothetical protein